MIYQITPTLLDALVLAVIEEGDSYGYMIGQRLKTVASQKESSLYPVLKRLLTEGCLTAYDQEYQGRNRRYYRITDQGKQKLSLYRTEWKDFKEAADAVLYGGICDE